MIRNLFIGIGAALLATSWLLTTLITPTMAPYRVQLTGDGETRIIEVTIKGKEVTATDLYEGAVDKDASGTYLIDPKSGFPAKKATHVGLTYFFPMPSEERSYVVADPLTGGPSTLDYVDPTAENGMKFYTYRESSPRFREVTLEPRSGIVVDAKEDVDGTIISYDEATRDEAMARATKSYRQYRSLQLVTVLLTLAGAGFIIIGGWLWLKRAL